MADVSSLHRQVEQRAQRAAVFAGADVRTDLQRAAPFDTGDTFRATDTTNFRFGPLRVSFTAIADTPQAKWTNDGTPPHEIRPRNKQVLRFRIGNRIVFAKVVQHPGFEGTRWFDRTLEEKARAALAAGWRGAG